MLELVMKKPPVSLVCQTVACNKGTQNSFTSSDIIWEYRQIIFILVRPTPIVKIPAACLPAKSSFNQCKRTSFFIYSKF